MSITFAHAAAGFLLELGPLTLDQLHALAVERDVTRARSSGSLRSSLSSPEFVVRPDGRYDTAARLLAGSVFTTRRRGTARDGVLWLSRDVDPLMLLADTTMTLSSGGTVRPGAGSTPTWVGPDGWLPLTEDGQLLALRWDGTTLAVDVPADVEAADSAQAQQVRRLLAAHAKARHRDSWPSSAAPPLATVVLSALVEDPALFQRPVPPLSELLPLPEELRPQDAWPRDVAFGTAEVLQVPLPRRVHRELARRADLLGDRLPDYAAMLLGAAADRLLPPPRAPYDRYDEELNYSNVIEPSRWSADADR